MRTFGKVFLSLFIVIVTAAIFPKQASAQQNNVSFQVFYDELSPFGSWVNYSDYGYVWIPDAGPDFEPYSTEGHWLFTDYGWTWMSDYSWGWAPFHYGRWDYDQNFGWFWVPGDQWGPAWVTWRRAEGYYGWAPMEPGISITVSFSRPYDRDRDHWIFVRDRDIDRSDINHYYVDRSDEDRIITRSSVVNNTYNDSRRHTTYIAGPDRTDFQRSTGKQVNPVIIQEYNKPGQNLSGGRLQIYRPEVVKNNDRASAPSRVTNLNDVRRPSERRTTNPNVNSNPSNNIKSEGQPTKDNSQGNVRDTRSGVNRDANPPENVRKEIRPDNTRPSNANPPKNTRVETQRENIKPQNTNPPDNVRKDVRKDNVKPPDNPQQNIRREAPPVDVKQQNNNQPQNVRREAPPVDVKQQNNSQPQNIRKDNQQNNTKTNRSDNTRREKANSAKSSTKDKRDQKKKSEDIKKDE